MTTEKNLPKINRYITTHDTNGQAIFSKAVSEEAEIVELRDKMGFALSYTTNTFPVDMTNETDIDAYKPYLTTPPGLTVSNGTVLRHVDFVPGVTSAMHRTVSLDYGIVIEGEIEARLDSGEVRLMKRGDVCVQRGTMHAWRNPSETEWCRMIFVLQACKPLEINGEVLGEALGSAEGKIRSST